MSLPEDLLQRPPQEAVRRIALQLLQEAETASRRLDDPDDSEALHDFRVAIRRLRSALRAWKPELEGAATAKHRRALRRLQEETGAGRDAEVGMAWLAEQRSSLRPQHRRGCDWLTQHLEERRREPMSHVGDSLRDDFEDVRARLWQRLESVQTHLGSPDQVLRFANVFCEKAREEVRNLLDALENLSSSEERVGGHRARITGKRLRYLVEPVRPQVPEARLIVKRCKELQDVLGSFNDAHVLREELASAVEITTVEHSRRLAELARTADPAELRREARRSERPGLLELTRRVQEHLEQLFTQLQEEWLRKGAEKLLEDVERMAERIERGPQPGVEIERKYLLRGLPELPPEAVALEVDQGWIPGEQLRERIRRVQDEEGARYYRTIKLGSGIQRIEIEDATSEEIFEPLWRLTKDCRVRKRRYLVVDGDFVWEIDEFLDRDLVLAEVELPTPSTRPALPGWLAEYVVREVTDDNRYTNFELAKSGERAPSMD